MKNNTQSGYIIPLVIALVAILIAGGAYLAYKNQKGQEEQAAQDADQIATMNDQASTTSTSAVSTPVNGNLNASSAAGWLTYTNNQYGFSFQYPTSYGSLNTLSDGGIIIGQGSNANVSIDMPKVLLDNSGQPKTLNTLTNDYNVKGTTENSVTVGGIQSLEVWSSQIGTLVFVPLPGNKFLEISGNHNDPSFSQMLSSFAFTISSNTSSSQPSATVTSPSISLAQAWMKMNTYKDPFGFSLSYPDTWSVAKQADGSVKIFTNSPETNTITISEVASTTVTVSSAKWEATSYYFDSTTEQWIGTGQSASDPSLDVRPMTITNSTLSGLPIFDGSIKVHGYGQYQYIVPLSTNKFLVVLGGETASSYQPDTDLLLNLVRTITNN